MGDWQLIADYLRGRLDGLPEEITGLEAAPPADPAGAMLADLPDIDVKGLEELDQAERMRVMAERYARAERQPVDRTMEDTVRALGEAVNQILRNERRGAEAIMALEGREEAEQAPGSAAQREREEEEYRRYKPILLPSDAVSFWAEILGNDSDPGDTHQWKYSWQEIRKINTGYGGWDAVADGRSGTTAVDPAYNAWEDANQNAGGTRDMNGVDPDNLDTVDFIFTVQPVQTGMIVRMYAVPVPNEDTEYWFAAFYGIDGECG